MNQTLQLTLITDSEEWFLDYAAQLTGLKAPGRGSFALVQLSPSEVLLHGGLETTNLATEEVFYLNLSNMFPEGVCVCVCVCACVSLSLCVCVCVDQHSRLINYSIQSALILQSRVQSNSMALLIALRHSLSSFPSVCDLNDLMKASLFRSFHHSQFQFRTHRNGRPVPVDFGHRCGSSLEDQ